MSIASIFTNIIENHKKKWYSAIFSLNIIVAITFYLLLFFVLPRDIDTTSLVDVVSIVAVPIVELLVATGFIIMCEMDVKKDPTKKSKRLLMSFNCFLIYLIVKYCVSVGVIYANNYYFSIIFSWSTFIFLAIIIVAYLIILFLRKFNCLKEYTVQEDPRTGNEEL